MILVMGADLAGVDVQREHRGGVQVVARPHIAHPRRRIARPPVAQVELGIIVRGEPDRHAARLPGLSGPGVVTGLTRPRNRVRLPHRLPVARVEGGDVPADAELAAGSADHDLALGDERRQGEVVAVLVVVDGRVPHDRARLGVERDEMRVDGRQEESVLPERHAAVRGMELEQVLRQLLFVTPEQVTGLGVER